MTHAITVQATFSRKEIGECLSILASPENPLNLPERAHQTLSTIIEIMEVDSRTGSVDRLMTMSREGSLQDLADTFHLCQEFRNFFGLLGEALEVSLLSRTLSKD